MQNLEDWSDAGLNGKGTEEKFHHRGTLARKNHALEKAARLLRARELLNSRFASV
jgi:hypothetical protein